MRSLLLLLILTSTTALCQQEKILTLPIERDMIIDGIESKLIILKIKGSQVGAFTDIILGFKDPTTHEWIYFEAHNIPTYNTDSEIEFLNNFFLRLKSDSERRIPNFLNSIIERTEDNSFQWKCGCQKIKNVAL
jgi:hypothetical protein